MRKVFTTIICLFAATLCFAQTAVKKITVTEKAGQVIVQNINISKDWKFAPLANALGIKNDRKRPGFNTTHSYDNYGIVLFEKNNDIKIGTGILSEMQFYFAQVDTNAVTPKGFFTGKMQIEKLQVSSQLTWTEVKDALKDFELTDSYMEHNYRLAYKGLYFYFLFDTDETTLLKVSIGKDMRGK